MKAAAPPPVGGAHGGRDAYLLGSAAQSPAFVFAAIQGGRRYVVVGLVCVKRGGGGG